MKTAIVNANLVLESGIVFDGSLLIENGRIENFGPSREMDIPADTQVIDAQGAYVGPGFVDIHVHAGGGYSTCWEPVQAAEFFLRHGETSILATTDYHMDTQTLLDAVKTIQEGMKKAPITGCFNQ